LARGGEGEVGRERGGGGKGRLHVWRVGEVGPSGMGEG